MFWANAIVETVEGRRSWSQVTLGLGPLKLGLATDGSHQNKPDPGNY